MRLAAAAAYSGSSQQNGGSGMAGLPAGLPHNSRMLLITAGPPTLGPCSLPPLTPPATAPPGWPKLVDTAQLQADGLAQLAASLQLPIDILAGALESATQQQAAVATAFRGVA